MMDRSREARRVNNMAAGNGFPRKRYRSGASSLRDSPDEDGQVELQENGSGRLRDRAVGKKDRDGYRERDRDRERERGRDRDRGERDRVMMLMMSNSSSRNKKRKAERHMAHQHHRGGLHFEGDDSSEESDNEEDEDEEGMAMLPPHNTTNQSSQNSSSSPTFATHTTVHPHSQHHHTFPHRKSLASQPATPNSPLPPMAITAPSNNISCKGFRSSPTSISTSTVSQAFVPPPWASDEVIGVSVPRRARSASTKRHHENRVSSYGGTVLASNQIHRHSSSSPTRSGASCIPIVAASASASTAPIPLSPPPSISTVKKRMRPNGPKQRPPKSTTKSSSVQDEIEIEIAEVLYGLMRQPQGPILNKPEANDSSKIENEVSNSKSAGDAKSRVSSPTSKPESIPPITTSAPKRKKPRPVKHEDEHPAVFPVRSSHTPSVFKVGGELAVKVETSSQSVKATGSGLALPEQLEPLMAEPLPESLHPLTTKPDAKEIDVSVKKEEPRSPCSDGLRTKKADFASVEPETQRGDKLEIDLMVLPPVRSSPDREGEIDFVAVGPRRTVSEVETPLLVKDEVKVVIHPRKDEFIERDDKRAKMTIDESEFSKQIAFKDKIIDLQLDLEKSEKDGSSKNRQARKQTLDKSAVSQNNSLPLPMSFAGWPGGIPHMGYMSPFQGVVSMNGNAIPSAALQPPPMLFNQQRPKRCATHCCIAWNIYNCQQFSRMNPFWPAASGSALPYGPKLNVIPTADVQGSRSANPSAEKTNGAATLPSQSGKEKHSTSNAAETPQRKQILLRQPLAPNAPNNIMHSPAFIFSLSQQQAAAAVAPARPGNATSSAGGAGTPSSSSTTASAAAATSTSAVNYNYSNMGSGDSPYLAILQNGAYPIPVPTHISSTPAYRGAHPQPMPFYNGSFYSSQILHPQLQQQPQQSQQTQRSHQPPIISTTSSQKHIHNQQSKAHGGNLQTFPPSKNHSSEAIQYPQRQPPQNINPGRPADGDVGSEDTPSAETRGSRSNPTVYGQNFVVPLHSPNFAFMSPAAITTNASDKKQGAKSGVDSQAFAMSFDMSSIAQNPSLLQGLPEAARHGFHFMQAGSVQSQSQKKSGGNDCSNNDDERKVKVAAGSSIAFSRSDISDQGVNTVIDSSGRSHNLTSTSSRVSGNVNSPTPQQQIQRAQQQIIQHQKQQQFNAPAPPRGKSTATSNGNAAYPDHVSSMPTKLPNNLAAQPSQWKNSMRTSMPQVHSPAIASTSPGIKNLPQQQIRPPQTQISFGATKSTPAQGQSNQSSNHSPPPMVVDSPKSAGGSPKPPPTSKGTPTKTPGPSPQQSSVSLTLGHLAAAPVSSSSPSKSQLPKVVLPPSQMMYPSSFVQQSPLPPSSTSSSPASGFYLPRHRNEQAPQTKATASSGVKSGTVSYPQFSVPQPSSKQHQLVTPAFPYAQPLPAAVQVKQADKKHPGE